MHSVKLLVGIAALLASPLGALAASNSTTRKTSTSTSTSIDTSTSIEASVSVDTPTSVESSSLPEKSSAPDSSGPAGNICKAPYSDDAVVPTLAKDYERYFTVYAVGTRSYSCKGGNFTLTNLDYDLYDAECKTKGVVGRRVKMLETDPSGGRFVQYSTIGAFTYMVSKPTLIAPDPAVNGSSYLPLQQEIYTQRSEPKWDLARGFDYGQATFLTRFGGTGNPTVAMYGCNTVTLNSTAYYSFWKYSQ